MKSLILSMLLVSTGASADATFTSLNTQVFQVSCVSCHSDGGPDAPADAGIDFTNYDTLMTANKGATKHAPFIIAGDPEHSKLYLTLKAGKMPETEKGDPGTPISDALIQDVSDWIQSGAPNN